MTEETSNTLYGFSDAEKQAYEAAASRNLAAPDGAAERDFDTKAGHKYVKSWSETVILRKVEFIVPGLKNPDEKDDVTCDVAVNFQVDLTSLGPDGKPSANIGKYIFNHFRYNFTAFTRDPEAKKGQANMTKRTINALAKLLKASGIDLGVGSNPQEFAETYGPSIVGTKYLGVITQERTEGDDRVNDSVTSFTAV